MRRKGGDAQDGPIPLDPVNVLAGIAPGVELTAGEVPAGVAGATDDEQQTVSVDEVGRMLRVNEATVRRLIRTAIIRPVVVDGSIRVSVREIEAYRAMHRKTPDKPGE